MKGTNGPQAAAALLIIGVIAYFHFSAKPSDAAEGKASSGDQVAEVPARNATVGTAPAPAAVAPSCSSERECAIDALIADAKVGCMAAISGRAKYDIRWEAGPLGDDMFARADWADATKTAVTFAGDAVSFQNGFGAFAHMSYFCTVNRVSREVTNLRFAEGRLPPAPDT